MIGHDGLSQRGEYQLDREKDGGRRGLEVGVVAVHRAARRRASRAPTPEVSAKRREFAGRRDLRRRARDRTSHARATARRASLRATCELAAITAIAARGLGRGHALCLRPVVQQAERHAATSAR